MGNGRSVVSSESRINIQDAGPASPHAKEFVRLNNYVHDLVSDGVGAVNKGSRIGHCSSVVVRTDGLVYCTLHCTGGCCMEVDTLCLF